MGAGHTHVEELEESEDTGPAAQPSETPLIPKAYPGMTSLQCRNNKH
uniref:Uncharacterized protein n=1 Tax=Arundo donax TaxID=35708 RepID=A0A0A9AEV1_ARUDO